MSVANLTLVKGSTSTMYNITQTESYIGAGNITAFNTTETINGQSYNVTGFNPSDLYDLNGWNWALGVTYTDQFGEYSCN